MKNAMPPRFRMSSTQPATDTSLPWSEGAIDSSARNREGTEARRRESRIKGCGGPRGSISLAHDFFDGRSRLPVQGFEIADHLHRPDRSVQVFGQAFDSLGRDSFIHSNLGRFQQPYRSAGSLADCSANVARLLVSSPAEWRRY